MQREQIAEMYAVEQAHWWFWSKRLLMRRLLGTRLRRSGLRILDIGCGAGANALELSRFGRVTAADRSLEALAFVRSRGVDDVVAAEAPQLPFRDASFDIVTAYDVIEHVDDDRGFVRELARVLVPGGALAVHVPAWPSLWSRHDVVLEHKRRYTRRSLHALLSVDELEIDRLGWTNFTIFAPTAALRLARRILPGAGSGGDGADLGIVPAPINWLLRGVGRAEAAVAATTGLPIGVSLAAIATRRPATGDDAARSSLAQAPK
ncbi:MAG TPA: class I SAM-dependent methyltransferase [Candidatus Binatia bacterium]|jgi:SAM-dependent methyltransferase